MTEKRPVVPFELIFQELRPHGAWLQLDGRWSWRPRDVGNDWQPFRNGSWVVTEFGWYWLSEHPWGWATSHYGRWEWHENGYWIWRPGNEWSPAWVAWRESPQAAGWHPLPPQAEKSLKKGLAGSAEEGFRLEGWTFMIWRDLGNSLLPTADSPIPDGKQLILEAVQLTSGTVQDATPELLAQTRDATRIVRKEDAALNRGPDPSLVETVLRRRPDPCALTHSKMRREILVFWKDRPILTCFRPILSETPEEMDAFITRKAEQYRAIRKQPPTPGK